MPRGGSRSSSSRSAPAPARRAPAPAPAARSAPPPAARSAAPPPAPAAPQQQSGGMLSGLGATMAQGFAFGTGSAIAREAVGSVMGAFSGDKKEAAPQQQAPPADQMQSQSFAPPACQFDQNEFMQCLQRNNGNAADCDHYYKALQACQSRM